MSCPTEQFEKDINIFMKKLNNNANFSYCDDFQLILDKFLVSLGHPRPGTFAYLLKYYNK
jgi:hypothetical protein